MYHLFLDQKFFLSLYKSFLLCRELVEVCEKIVLSVVCRSHAHSSIVVTQESAVFEESNLCVGWFKK